MKRAFAVFVVSGILAAFQESAARSPVPVAFTNVFVVAMESADILEDHTVVVMQDRITAIGPAATTVVPVDAIRIDGHGKYLTPGLAEMHGHIPPPSAAREFIEDALFLYVANGVTTVRGMQGAPGQLALRDSARDRDLIAPTLYLAGPAFSGSTVRTAEEASARVRRQHAEGWDLLKVLGGLSREAYDAMAMTATTVGMPFGGHVPAAVGVTHALDMGQQTFDHIDGYAEHLGGLTAPVDEQALQDLVTRTKRAGASIVPTLVVWETLRGPVTARSRTTLPELRYMPRNTVQRWTETLENRLRDPRFNSDQAKQYIDNRLHILRTLHAAGIDILLGSDAPQQFNVPGFSIHREMRRMIDAGMTPYDILRAGTTNVGRHFQAKDDFGTIAVGNRADLILVNANPLQDVAHMARIAGVMVRGRWLPASEIEIRLDQIAEQHGNSQS